MRVWPEVVSTALVGTSRKSFMPELTGGPVDELLQQQPRGDDPAQSLLRATAVLSLYRRAGELPSVALRGPVEPAGPDEWAVCREEVTRHLRVMLGGRFANLLPMALAAMGRARLRVPHELLPVVFEQAKTPELRSLARVVGDERGRWLARQNPAWRWVLAADTAGTAGVTEAEQIWQTGSLDERAAAMAAVRQREPARARELIESTWNADKADPRVKFIEVLANGLSGDDEAFLESRLEDRSLTVRRAAAALLARIPGSALSQRMAARLARIIEIRRKGLLRQLHAEVQLEAGEFESPALLRDGIKAQSATPGVGEKASVVLQMMTLVPPTHWAQNSGHTPAALLEAAGRGDWKDLLWTGWRQAAEHHRDQQWADAFAAVVPFEGLGDELLRLLSNDVRERVLWTFLESAADAGLMQNLARVPGPWSRRFTMALLTRAAAAHPGYLTTYIGHLLLAALPKMADVSAADIAGEWPEPLQETVRGLQFKRTLLDAIGERN